MNNSNTEPQKRIYWYADIYPYTEILKTSEQGNYLFALLLNDKLVAIGSERDGVIEECSVIFNTWLKIRKEFLNYQKYAEHINNIIKEGRKLNNFEIDRAKHWLKLFELIKGKKFIGRRELPPQPRQMLYRTFYNNEMYIIYENKWRQPERFSLWSSNKEFFAKSRNLPDITEKLGKIVGRKITLIQ